MNQRNSPANLQSLPGIWIDMSLIENASQSSNGNLTFSGDDCSIDDRSLTPHELYVATLL